MVAINQMMPQNPSDKDFVERTLRRHPSLARFLDRLQSHSEAILDRPSLHLDALAHDEWDPPLILEITANVPDDAYISQLHELRRWAQDDADFDASVLRIVLLRRVEPLTSAR